MEYSKIRLLAASMLSTASLALGACSRLKENNGNKDPYKDSTPPERSRRMQEDLEHVLKKGFIITVNAAKARTTEKPRNKT